MNVVQALERVHGVARMRDLRRFGINREAIWIAIRAQQVMRVRNGWIALQTISPIEIRAVAAHGLLTCASAASVLGLPVEAPHFHIRAKLQKSSALRTVRRKLPSRIGACVGLVELVVDYLDCQKQEWSLALVDSLERSRRLTAVEWAEVERATTQANRKLLTMKSGLAESPLESIVRYRLSAAKIPHNIQVVIGKYRVDFVIGHGVILETHGAEFHADRADWERDRRRVAALKADGWDVIEVSFSQVLDEWDSVLAAIRASRFRQRNVTISNFLETNQP